MAAPPPPPPPPPPGISSAPPPILPTVTPDRNALLGDIRKGKALKKATTNDRSAPAVGNSSNSSNSGMPSMPSIPSSSAPSVPSGSNSSSNPMGMGPQLGDIFAGGMPKLKHVSGSSKNTITPPSAPSIPMPFNSSNGKTSSSSVPFGRPQNTVPNIPKMPTNSAPPIPTGAPPLPSSSMPSIPKMPSSRPTSIALPSNASSPQMPSRRPPNKAPGMPVKQASFAPPIPGAPPPLPNSNFNNPPQLPSIIPPKAPSIPNSAAPPPPPGPPPPPSFNSAPVPSGPPPPPSFNSAPPPPGPPPPPSFSSAPAPNPAKTSSSAAGGLPFLAEINQRRDDRFVVDDNAVKSSSVPSNSTSFSKSSNPPSLPRLTAPAVPSAPPSKAPSIPSRMSPKAPSIPSMMPPKAPSIPSMMPPKAPALPMTTSAPPAPPVPPAFSKSSTSSPPPPPPGPPPPPSFTSAPSPPGPPPPPSFTSAPPPPGPPPPPSFNSAPAPKIAKSSPPAAGGLPFLAEINQRRNDAFVVDDNAVAKKSSAPTSAPREQDVGPVLKASAPQSVEPVSSGNPLMDEIMKRTHKSTPSNTYKSPVAPPAPSVPSFNSQKPVQSLKPPLVPIVPSSKPPSAPSIPATPPPPPAISSYKAPEPPAPPMASPLPPSVPPSIPPSGPPSIPTSAPPAPSHSYSQSYNDTTSDTSSIFSASTSTSTVAKKKRAPPLPPSHSSSSTLTKPAPSTQAPSRPSLEISNSALNLSSTPSASYNSSKPIHTGYLSSVEDRLSNIRSKFGSGGSGGLFKSHKYTPSKNEDDKIIQQQVAGNEIRKIDMSAYTINGSANGGHSNLQSSGNGNVKMESPRFRFIEQNELPKPHKFEGRIKLYPSGRGSSMPLDISMYS